jgi:hypothetical protein
MELVFKNLLIELNLVVLIELITDISSFISLLMEHIDN